MVSFSCEVCNETVPKKKCNQHQRICRGAYFTCLDCQKTFEGNDYVRHTSCISEAEKYEKGLYKGKKSQKQVKKPTPGKKPKEANETKQVQTPVKGKAEEEPLDLSKFAKKNEPVSLYKVFKKLQKTAKSNKHFEDKKEFLKAVKLTLNENGTLTASL
ncbi:DEKNAAC101779 [Brettanomyces naardenensis]|uniref:DEKNAAC101779 n=1 Tax=Brettanomyces naardenensis TaxID=13370 RepID=A0A448YIT0_BRENA|nr:DEKNAAC101779 [Brettanomyces naardenensis]